MFKSYWHCNKTFCFLSSRFRTAECLRSDDQPAAETNCGHSAKPRTESDECNTNCYIQLDIYIYICQNSLKFFFKFTFISWLNPECASDCSRRQAPTCVNKTMTGVIKQLDSIYCADMPKPPPCETPCWRYGEWQNVRKLSHFYVMYLNPAFLCAVFPNVWWWHACT